MNGWRLMGRLAGIFALGGVAWGQAGVPNQQNTACTFEDGGQVSVRYEAADAHGDKPPEGRAWSPGDSPMFLFTSTAVKLGDDEIPVGAYSMFVIPEKHAWTLVVSKDVNGKKYDPQQDLAREPMELGSLDQGEKTVSMVVGHIAPKVCSLRLYYGKTGAWVEFKEP
jgi:Protein of unknown function (DUF2911)